MSTRDCEVREEEKHVTTRQLTSVVGICDRNIEQYKEEDVALA